MVALERAAEASESSSEAELSVRSSSAASSGGRAPRPVADPAALYPGVPATAAAAAWCAALGQAVGTGLSGRRGPVRGESPQAVPSSCRPAARLGPARCGDSRCARAGLGCWRGVEVPPSYLDVLFPQNDEYSLAPRRGLPGCSGLRGVEELPAWARSPLNVELNVAAFD